MSETEISATATARARASAFLQHWQMRWSSRSCSRSRRFGHGLSVIKQYFLLYSFIKLGPGSSCGFLYPHHTTNLCVKIYIQIIWVKFGPYNFKFSTLKKIAGKSQGKFPESGSWACANQFVNPWLMTHALPIYRVPAEPLTYLNLVLLNRPWISFPRIYLYVRGCKAPVWALEGAQSNFRLQYYGIRRWATCAVCLRNV